MVDLGSMLATHSRDRSLFLAIVSPFLTTDRENFINTLLQHLVDLSVFVVIPCLLNELQRMHL
jgi:hypothetical protein